jgi:hypothetical protein
MNVLIRALGLAITIFWLLLFLIIGLAAYSAKDLDFSIGEPQFSTPSQDQLVISLPLYVDNRGYCSVKQFQISTVFSDTEGREISKATSFVPIIMQGERITILHNATLSLPSLLEGSEQYFLDDDQITASITVEFNFADLLPTQISTNLTLPAVSRVAGNAEIELFKRINFPSSERQVSDPVYQYPVIYSKVEEYAQPNKPFSISEKWIFRIHCNGRLKRGVTLVMKYG